MGNHRSSKYPPKYPLIASSLEKIETLYGTLLSLTEESEAADDDRQIVIEALRDETLEKADLIFEEIKQSEDPMPEQAFLNQKKRLLILVDKIRNIDQKKTMLIKEAQSVLMLEMQSLHFGKQAVTQYQKSIPTEN